MSKELPEPRLSLVYRLEATLGEPLDLGDIAQGRRRIVPQTGGTFVPAALPPHGVPHHFAPLAVVVVDARRTVRVTVYLRRRILPMSAPA